MEKLVEPLIMFVIGGLIALSPVNFMLHELLHKVCLDKMGVKSKIIVKFLIFKWEGFKFSFIPIKDKSKFEAVTYPDDLSELDKCNKREKIIMYLLPTVVLTFVNVIILLSYLVIFKQTITSNFSIMMITIILCEILAGKYDMIDTYKLCVNK